MNVLLKRVVKYLARKFAALYISYLKPEIDAFVLNQQKRHFARLGDGVKFKGGGTIYHPDLISISDYVHIGDNYFLMGIGGIEIGTGTIISRNVCLHSGNHDFKNNDFLPYSSNYDLRKIVIGKGVWIGQNVNVLPGVVIGDGAIIGMGVTLAKNVSPGEIIVNSTNRSLGFRDPAALERLLKEEKFISKHQPNI